MHKNSTLNFDKNFKILLLGDCSVGKTCFLLRYVEDTFTENHITTIGVDYKTKVFQEEKSAQLIKLQIWDTAGQDKFRCITKNYFRGSNGILLIYDITNQNSFKNIRNWVSQIKESLADEACIVLVGNKVDLDAERKVATGTGQNLANEFKMDFFEASAKNNFNIESAFAALAQEMVKKYENNIERSKSEVKGKPSEGFAADAEKGRSYSQKLRNYSVISGKNGSDKDGKKKKWC